MRTGFILIVLSMQTAVWAANLTVHNTGVNSSNVLVAAGGQASFWTLSAKPSGAVETLGSNPFRFNCCYFADTSNAAWVAPQASGNAGLNGIYIYDLVVDLTGFDPTTASISGTFGTDNDGSISVNSNAPAATTCFACFGSPTAFTISSGFVAGLNTIHLSVNNGGDPTAFFVSFTSATATPTAPPATPIPGTLLLSMIGILGLGLYMWRRSARMVLTSK